MRGSRFAILAFALLVLTGACNRGPDPTAAVRKALDQAQLSMVQVAYDRDVHIVHLKGTVNAAADRARAEEVAASAVGTTGRVLNELTIRNVNDKTADDFDGAIRRDLAKMAAADPRLKDRDLEFDVTNGVVTVKGEVGSAEEKQHVTELVRAAPGVKDMANAVEIKPPDQRR